LSEDAPQKPRAPRPRDAATLILLDGKGAKARVLMGRRHPDLKFMPGQFVFPGGRLDPCDRRMNIAGPLDARVEHRLQKRRPGASLDLARALALAAIRELYEETGIALGASDYGCAENPPPGAWTDYSAHHCLPDLQELHFIARAITPPARPRRFDTRFFAANARAIAAQVEGHVHDDAELVELRWVRLDEAEKLDPPAITRRVLADLREKLDAGLSRWATAPFYYERRGKWVREEL
jgi:8-oxo-dGTP pyrophosphatase MutT (NUDIX family)